MSFNITVLDGGVINPGDLSWEKLDELGEVNIYDATPDDKVVKRLKGCQAVLTNKVTFTKEVMKACPELKYVGITATGYNIIDLEFAKQRGIVVTNVPAYSTYAVAQHAMALLLEICNGVGVHDASVKAKKWCQKPEFCYWEQPILDLYGKTMGIIGTGAIGVATGKLASALGMNVICNSRSKNEDAIAAGFEYVTQDELFERADVVSLHCALTDDTANLICKDNLDKMKNTAIILNTSRGGVINEIDLADALNKGKIFAAGVDVVSVEPMKEDNPLLTAKNSIITPHIAWASRESRQRLLGVAIENLAQYIKGTPQNVVV